MINLAAGETISGAASVDSAVTYTITGMELSNLSVETYHVLAQGTLSAVAGTLYTAPVTEAAFVKTIFMANTTANPVSVTLYVNGTAAANEIGTCVIPRFGHSIINQVGWDEDPQYNKRFKPGERITVATQISGSGDNIIVTPTTGASLRVTWVGMSSSEIGVETLATVKFGAGGTAKYKWYMGAPGAFSHWEAIEGAVDESLIVNLSVGAAVQVNVTYEIF